MFVAGIVPFITRQTYVYIPPELQIFSLNGVDFFSFYRAAALKLAAGAVFFYFASDLIIAPPDNIKAALRSGIKNPVIVLPSLFLLLAIVSAIFSDYKYTAIWGVFDRREGLLVICAYIILFFTSYFWINSEERARFITPAFCLSAFILGIIGISQLINRDFFSTELARFLVQGADGEGIRPAFTMAYSASFNPNTFGLICAMLTPFLAGCALAEKRIVWRFIYILALIPSAIGIIGSRSAGGLIGGAAGLLVFGLGALFAFKIKNKKQEAPQNKKIKPLIFILSGAVLLAFFFFLLTPIRAEVSYTIEKILRNLAPEAAHIPDYYFGENYLIARHGDLEYTVFFSSSEAPKLYSNNEQVEPRINITETGLEIITFNLPGRRVVIERRDATFFYSNKVILALENDILKIVGWGEEIVTPNNLSLPRVGFEGWETWGSNRGYIFSHAIALLPKHIFLGTGSDTFLLAFPQDDYVNRLRYFNTAYMLVDKAHNLFLHTAITTGLISAIILFALFFYYVITAFFSLSKSKTPYLFFMRLGTTAAVSAYIVSSMATDSTVSSAPIFWIILGLGFALNNISARKI